VGQRKKKDLHSDIYKTRCGREIETGHLIWHILLFVLWARHKQDALCDLHIPPIWSVLLYRPYSSLNISNVA
jgi:hypothetical protein